MKLSTENGVCATALALLLLAVSPCQAESARELKWEDLVPQRVKDLSDATVAIRRELSTLSAHERVIYNNVAQELFIREQLAAGATTDAELSDRQRELLDSNPSANNATAVTYWTRLKTKRRQLQAESGKVDAQLADATIRLPGYMLPLGFDGDKVREFLLVPYLGACIHTPPPPPNQIVHVQSNTAIESDGLYTPVWIEGTLLIEGKSSDLTYIDGSAAVAAGYSMRDALVEPFKQ